MAQVSSVVLKYAARGADSAARKDRKVRESVKRTGREARKQQSTVRRWMQRHRAAIAGIGAATAAALVGILKKSPTIRGELAGMRLAFSLFAMTVGEDVAPALEGVSDTLLDVQEGYADLDPAVRKPISALITFGLVTVTAAAGLAVLETVVAGTTVGAVLAAIGAKAYTAAGGIAAFAGSAAGVALAIGAVLFGLGLLGAELVGVIDATDRVSESQNRFVRAAASLAFFLVGPWIGMLAAAYAFWIGGWDNAKRVFFRFLEETLKSFMRFAVELGAGLTALHETIQWAFATAWAGVKNESKKFFNWLLSSAESTANSVISELNKLPKFDFDKVSFGRMQTQSRAQLGRNARQDFGQRMQSVSRRRDALQRRFAAKQVQLRPESQRAADAQPQPGSGTKVEDNRTQVEELRVEVPPSTGDPQADGREAGRAAMEYIEERRGERR